MEKKMRGVVDPYSLGLVIALIAPLFVSNAHDNGNTQEVQSATSQSHDTEIVAWHQDADDRSRRSNNA